jgi:hypothetical protein
VSKIKELWQKSLLFRRVAAVCVLAAAAGAVYLASSIPRAVSLPDDDLNAKSFARLGEEKIVLEKPDIAEGGLALSYVGSRNEVADLWLESANLDENSRRLLMPGANASTPTAISYITAGQVKAAPSDDTCHTTILIRRAAGSSPVDALTLYQSDQAAGAQRFRQVVLDAGKTPMEVEVHTDPPPQGGMDAPGCQKVLTVGQNPSTQMPPLPVRFLVTGGKIDLHFNPANPAVSIWTGNAQTFEAVSLGANTLHAARMKVVSANGSTGPAKLDIKASSKGEVTLSHLKLGSDKLLVDIGADGEKAIVYANGESQYNYDLIAAVQKNPILGFVFAAVLVPALWVWVKKNLFPAAETTEKTNTA